MYESLPILKLPLSFTQNFWRAFHSHLLDDLEVVELPEIPRLCRDPDDDKVIATAIYGIADYIVTIDRDLLTRKLYCTVKATRHSCYLWQRIGIYLRPATIAS
ncbi:MAG: putative toxin-antitoxin system toxin component, PIN family, partial [Rhodobacteraceae bacterium]|nr:putative toxin-antitoxin system toxin component, PIN family [Paracoccaceae bacterium]